MEPSPLPDETKGRRYPPLLGQDKALDRIAKSLSEGRLHHGWLLGGPEGIGKFKTALHLAAWLLSLSNSSVDGLFDDEQSASQPHPQQLDATHPDARLALNQTHPDMLIIKPFEDDKNKSGQIKTDQIRELNSFFAHSAARGSWRIAIIDSLDLVNINGQNAMLKILEEPPQQSVLLILNNRPGVVLPTVRSRCTPLAMEPLTKTQTMQVLKTLWPSEDDDYISRLAGISGGAPGQAVRLAEAEVMPLFEASCRLLADAATRPEDLWTLAEKWSPTGNKGRAVRAAALFLFDKLITSASVTVAGREDVMADEFIQLDFVKAAMDKLISYHDANQLARQHQEFCYYFRQTELLFIDFSPIFAKFLCKLHSQTRSG